MSGRTGKLTQQALAARGPRMIACQVHDDDFNTVGVVILREGQSCFAVENTDAAVHYHYYVRGRRLQTQAIAKSFSLSYLMKIARANK